MSDNKVLFKIKCTNSNGTSFTVGKTYVFIDGLGIRTDAGYYVNKSQNTFEKLLEISLAQWELIEEEKIVDNKNLLGLADMEEFRLVGVNSDRVYYFKNSELYTRFLANDFTRKADGYILNKIIAKVYQIEKIAKETLKKNERLYNIDYNKFVDDVLVGSLRVTMYEDFCNINKVFVPKQHRNKGVGTALIKDIVKIYGDRLLELGVAEDNLVAQKIYEKFGFKTVDTFYEDNIKIFKMERQPNVLVNKNER